MISVIRKLRTAKQQNTNSVVLTVEEVEGLLARNKDMDEKIAHLMSKLSEEDCAAFCKLIIEGKTL